MVMISVILPVYNAASTVADAIKSILNQTFTDFEFIIINDGSTDESEKKILEFDDQRIKYYSNEGNKGLIYTLNRGIELSTGKYIARMDADDISLPERFEKQIQVMEENPNIIVCGTQIQYFGANKKKSKFISPHRSEENKSWLIRESCFAHPTVMMRRNILITNNICYNSDYKNAEDYKMWIDLVEYGDFYNIQEILLKYRLSYTQITQCYNTEQIKNARRCRREYLSYLLGGNNRLPDKINIKTIRSFYKYHKLNKHIIEVLYLSLDRYNLFNLFYFLFSFDWMSISLFSNLAIFKRFFLGKNSLI